MVDTTDYTMDWNSCYKNWYSGDNYYHRDRPYSFFCGDIHFAGKYVNPRFLMNYMKGDYNYVKKQSRLNSFKQLNVFLLLCIYRSLLAVMFLLFSSWIHMVEEVNSIPLVH